MHQCYCITIVTGSVTVNIVILLALPGAKLDPDISALFYAHHLLLRLSIVDFLLIVIMIPNGYLPFLCAVKDSSI